MKLPFKYSNTHIFVFRLELVGRHYCIYEFVQPYRTVHLPAYDQPKVLLEIEVSRGQMMHDRENLHKVNVLLLCTPSLECLHRTAVSNECTESRMIKYEIGLGYGYSVLSSSRSEESPGTVPFGLT